MKESKLYGVSYKSIGVYEPDWYYHTIIGENENFYITFTNNFNLSDIPKSEFKEGYVEVLPSECFSGFEDFSESMSMAYRRWVKKEIE